MFLHVNANQKYNRTSVLHYCRDQNKNNLITGGKSVLRLADNNELCYYKQGLFK